LNLESHIDMTVTAVRITDTDVDPVAGALVLNLDPVAIGAFLDRGYDNGSAVVAGYSHIDRDVADANAAAGPEPVRLLKILRCGTCDQHQAAGKRKDSEAEQGFAHSFQDSFRGFFIVLRSV